MMNPASVTDPFKNDFFSDSSAFYIQSLLHNTNNGILAIDRQYAIVFFNSFFEKLTGKKKQDVLGKNIFEVFPQVHDLGLKEVYDKTFNGATPKVRNSFKSSENTFFHYEGTYYPVTGRHQEVIGAIAIFQDISHLIKSEKELRNSYSRLQENKERLQETRYFARIGNWERDLNTGETNWEEYLCNEIFEIPPHYERTLKGYLELVHPDDRDFVIQKTTKIIQDETEEKSFEYRLITPGGKLKYLSSFTKPLYDSSGKAFKVRGYSQDITRIKRTESLLKAVLENCFHGIVYAVPVLSGDEIIDFKCVLGNQSACNLINHGNIDIQGKWVARDLYYNDKESGLFADFKHALNTGSTIRKIHFYPKFKKWFSVKVLPMLDGLLINFDDVSEAKLMEQQLLELNSELEEKIRLRTTDLEKEKEHFQFLAEAIPQLVFISTSDSSEYVNAQWARFHKPENGEDAADWWRLLHPEDVELTSHLWKEANEKGTEFNTEYRLRRDDGEYIWFMVRAIPIKDGSGKVIRWFGTCTDIHKIKEAERSLKMHSSILTNMAEGVCVADQQGNITYTNPAFDKMFGYAQGELLGKDVAVITSEYPHSRVKFEKMRSKIIETGQWSGEMKNRKKDGSSFFTFGHINCISIQGQLRIVAVQADMTDIKKNQQLLQESAERLNKLNEELYIKNGELTKINHDLDNFVYTASHDLKAPVSNIEGLIDVLNDNLSKESREQNEVQHILSMIHDSIHRFKTTINDLTDICKVSKNAEDEEEVVNVNDLVEDICCMSIKNLIDMHKPVITMDYRVDKIRFSRKNLRSIFYNLISNGIKYKAENRPSEIKIQTIQNGKNEVLVLVSDNGLGIHPSEKHKLFNMYKRLHHHVDGTGIGLYIVKRIVDNAGGRIEVESEVGKGTTFKVYLKNNN